MAEVTSEQFEREIRAGAERGKQIDNIASQMESITKWRLGVDRLIEKHGHTLYGNGQPGMDEILRNINDWVGDQKSKEKESWSDTKKFVLGALAFILNTLLAIVIARLFTP